MPRDFMSHPYTLVFWATMVWGFGGIYVKWLLLPILYLAALRTLVPVLITGGWAFWKGHSLGGQPRGVWMASGLNALRTVCYFVGFTHLPIAQAVVLMYTWPIWLVVLERFFFKVPFEKRQFWLMLLAFLGIVIVQGFPQTGAFHTNYVIGGVALGVAALSNALMLLLFKKNTGQMTVSQTVFYQNIVGAILFLPFLYFGFSFPLWKTGMAVFFSAFVGIVGYVFFFAAMQRAPSSRIALLSYFEILTNIFWAYLLLHEGLTWPMLLGGTCILTAAVLMKPGNLKTP